MTPFTSRICKFSKVLLLTLFLVLAVCPCVFAEEVVANIQVLSLHESFDFVLEFFDDSLFDNDARIYNHDMAGTSMCMAMSAFRPYKSESDLVSTPDEKLLAFLTSSGFSDFVSDDYDKNPSLYTVATAIGRKNLTDADGNPYTVIAVGVCGGGYEDEWLSNLTVGSGNRHQGFDSAAHMVVNRIFGYIGTRNITGRIKIWISGYSRAAAVSNIAAADLTSSGYFREEDIFAYTFATPNTVKNPEREYSNIFNIVGQYDIVPMVPLTVWGFKRYGTVLTTPTQETDSDYLERLNAGPDIVHRLFTGSPYWNNVEMNNELHTMLSFLGEICPTSEIYEMCMQDRLISIMKNRNPVNVLRNLFEMADDSRLITDENRVEADQFINRFARLIYKVLSGNKTDDQWNADTPVFVNLVHEHGPEVYFSWVMGADPEVAFTTNHIYATVGVYPVDPVGRYAFRIVNEADGSTIAVVEGNSIEYLSETFHPHVTILPDRALFRLPMDGNYSIVMESENICDYVVVYMPTDPAGLIDQDVYLNSGEAKNGGTVLFTTNVPIGDDWDYFSAEEDGFNTDQIRSIQGYETLPFSWRTIIISIIFVPVLLVMILTWLALFVTSKVRKTGFKSLDYLMVCVLLILVIFDGIFLMIVRKLTYQLIIRTLIALVLVGIYLKRKKAYTPVTTLIIALSVADITLIFNRYISTFVMVGAYFYMVYICMRGKKIPVNRIIYWAAVSTVSVLLLSAGSFRVQWYDVAVLCISLLVPFASWDKGQNMRSAGILFVVKQILFMFFLYSDGVSMSLFFMQTLTNYLAMLILAMGGRKSQEGVQRLIS